MLEAKDFNSFGEAIVKKMIAEIAGVRRSDRHMHSNLNPPALCPFLQSRVMGQAADFFILNDPASMSLLMALSRHIELHCTCMLFGGKADMG